MRLDELICNPENPRKITQSQVKRLSGKLKRVPEGLTAMRIAYVTDKIDGKKVVIAGNTRLQALKSQFGEDGVVPDEWFQDVTGMSEAERHEFIVTSNISDGDWDIDKLLRDYDQRELDDLGLEDLFAKMPETEFDDIDNMFEQVKQNMNIVVCPHCGKENIVR